MKHTAGYAKPRRMAAPKAAPKRKVRLDLQRRPKPEPEDEVAAHQQSNFWKWVGVVALLHLVVFGLFYFIYETAPVPKPPESFMSLLPPGDVVKGTPGAQAAHKLGATTPAPAVHHASAPPPPPVIQPPKPVAPKPLPPKPILKTDAPPVALDKPIPKPPKVKVDLTLADAPAPDKPVTKPKPHLKKPPAKTTDNPEDQDHEAAAKSNSSGLSKEQIAAKLGEKLDAAGIKNAVKSGTSGSSNNNQNQFSEFYQMIGDQVKDKWEGPNLSAESALSPVVHIRVEKDGRVPPESVYLIQSSGNSSYDDSAVAAAKNLGYLHEPLPYGCSPDITIHIHPY